MTCQCEGAPGTHSDQCPLGHQHGYRHSFLSADWSVGTQSGHELPAPGSWHAVRASARATLQWGGDQGTQRADLGHTPQPPHLAHRTRSRARPPESTWAQLEPRGWQCPVRVGPHSLETQRAAIGQSNRGMPGRGRVYLQPPAHSPSRLSSGDSRELRRPCASHGSWLEPLFQPPTLTPARAAGTETPFWFSSPKPQEPTPWRQSTHQPPAWRTRCPDTGLRAGQLLIAVAGPGGHWHLPAGCGLHTCHVV